MRHASAAGPVPPANVSRPPIEGEDRAGRAVIADDDEIADQDDRTMKALVASRGCGLELPTSHAALSIDRLEGPLAAGADEEGGTRDRGDVRESSSGVERPQRRWFRLDDGRKDRNESG